MDTATVLSYKGSKSKVSVTVPPPSSSGVYGKGILEERDLDTSKIHKRSSKLPVYKGGKLPICNIDREKRFRGCQYVQYTQPS